MHIALLAIGFLALVAILMWAHSRLTDASDIDKEEEQDVRAQSPQERERASFEHAIDEAQRKAEDVDLYSRGEESGEESRG